MMEQMNKRVAVIGGGAAGLLAAGRAGELGADVTIFERNDRMGKKLRITGKGRCNLTNNCERDELMANIPRNPRFLYTALAEFPPSRVMEFFEELGVPLKTERGNRVFPVSDKAQDIVDALMLFAVRNGVKTVNQRVLSIEQNDGVFDTVITERGKYPFDAIIIATGGKSYPLTGSDGDGYRFAALAGHTITPLRPSLVPLETVGKLCGELMGLSLKNVTLTIKNEGGKVVHTDFGEMLFTHFGLSGPLVLSASAHLADIEKHRYTAIIDLKPALDTAALDARILSDFAKYANRDFINALGDLLPIKMILPIIKLSGIDPRKKVNSVSRDERQRLLQTIKSLSMEIKGTRPINEAIITSGGVDVREINPRTMESKLVPNLYFAGEIIDVDGYTGGFNLQIAFSTAYLAGTAAAGL